MNGTIPLSLRRFWPEILLAAAFLFFAFRELGTFPDAWADDSLFMIVARNLAEGRGYSIPVFGDLWAYPYILGVGPTVIVPSALSIGLFGFSVAAARLPMTLFLAASVIATYAFAQRMGGKNEARWATALLISFSAFVNTGKPVLGEIPAFFFVLAGLLLLEKTKTSGKHAMASGFCFGLAVVTKLTYGLVFPALAAAWIVLIAQKNWPGVKLLTVIGVVAGLTFLLFSPILGYWDPGFIGELKQYGLADGGGDSFQVLRTQPELLLRFQYLAFGVILLLGGIGIWVRRKTMTAAELTVIVTLILLLILFFLNGRGWYRHLLLAHLLLIPFVPAGTLKVTGKRLAAVVLAGIVITQGWWQLSHRGSRLSPEAAETAVALAEQFSDRQILITQPEIYVRAMGNPRWLFLSEEFKLRSYARFEDLPVEQTEHCLPILRKISEEEAKIYAGRLTPVHRRYMLIEPPAGCTPRSRPS